MAARESLNQEDSRPSLRQSASAGEGDKYSRILSRMSTTGLSMGLMKEPFDSPDSSKITFGQAVMTMILNCVGSGILFFPKVMADVGVAAAPCLCLLCAFVCLEAGTLISNTCSMAEAFEGTEITSYENLARFVGGPNMEKVVVVTKNFAMLGFIIVYFGLVADSIAQFFPQPAPMTLIRFAIVFPIFGLLAMLRNLKQLAQFAVIGIIAMGIECVLLVSGCYLIGQVATDCPEGQQGDDCRWFTIPPPTDSVVEAFPPMGKAMSIFLFSYAILATVPSVRSQLKDPEQMPVVLSSSFGFCALLNIFIMSMGYWAFGGNVEDNQNDGITTFYPMISQVVAIAIIINLLLSTPLYSYCIISVFEATGTDALRTPLTVPNMGFRAGLILALATTNHFLPYAMEVIGLVSSVFACANNILFPVIFFYLARKVISSGKTEAEGQQMVSVSSVKYALHGIVLLVGLCVLVFGVQGSLNTLLRKICESNTPDGPC